MVKGVDAVFLVAFGLGGQGFGTGDSAGPFQSFTGGSFRAHVSGEEGHHLVGLALEVLVVAA